MRVMNPCWYIVNNKKNACFLKCYLYLMHLRKGLLILFLSFSRVATLPFKDMRREASCIISVSLIWKLDKGFLIVSSGKQ
jgi:hypothetical protein